MCNLVMPVVVNGLKICKLSPTTMVFYTVIKGKILLYILPTKKEE